jgi:hypothetical protein
MEGNLPQTEEELKKFCVEFFRWWWNQPGTNTECGYDVWRKQKLDKEQKP